jgi:hypothetical protein
MRHGDIANSGIFEFKLAVYTFKNPLGHGHLEGATVRKRISRTLPYQRIGRKAIEVSENKRLCPGGPRSKTVSFGTVSPRRLSYSAAVPPKRGPVNNPTTYAWEAAYVIAILETDEAKMHCRLYDAIAALEQRRLSPVSDEEEVVLSGAEAGLQLLISEATEKYA